ncbi:MAG: NrdH-redoxin [Chloroflexi bacterium]|nr:NrdH-redoxin [Chloroflexota bacterium]
MPQPEQTILVYGTTWCPDCTRAKKFFDQHCIPYQWINIEEVEGAADTVLELNDGRRSVPTILFPDGSVLVEPSNRELAQKMGLE